MAAFVKTEMRRSNVVPECGLSYQRAVLFLSELRIPLSKKLAQMPPAYASIIKTTLLKCLARPPSNCSPEVYRLIGQISFLCIHSYFMTISFLRSSRLYVSITYAIPITNYP